MITEAETINKVINLIYNDIDVILPLFTLPFENKQIMYGISEQYRLFYKIKKYKPNLGIFKESVYKEVHKQKLTQLLSV